jgi:hypothetical protein
MVGAASLWPSSEQCEVQALMMFPSYTLSHTQVPLVLGIYNQYNLMKLQSSEREQKQACSLCAGYMQHFLRTHARHKNNRDGYMDSRPTDT